MKLILAAPLAALLLLSCGSEPKTAETAPPKKAEAVKPLSQAWRMPKTNLVDSKVIDSELMGKSFMPGGTIAHYKKGAAEWDLFIAKMPSVNDAAITLPDWRKVLTDSKLVPSFGGYFGKDNGKPVFVFSKGAWIAGVAGLPEKEADLAARTLAGQLD